MRTLALAAGLAMAHSAAAQTAAWINPAGGDWYDPANWAGGALPEYGPGSVRFDLDAAYAVAAPPFGYEGRRLAVERSELSIVGDHEAELHYLLFTESEAANPPAVVIGWLSGESASLSIDFSLSGPFMVVGAAGRGELISSDRVAADALVVGGVADNTDAVGDLSLLGPEALLVGRGASPRTDLTLGLVGTGRCTLVDGAVARVGNLRTAVEAGSRAEALLTGSGTRLEVEHLDLGLGSSVIVVADGATLVFPDGYKLVDAPGEGPIRLVLDGGRVEGLADLQVNRHDSELVIRGGAELTLVSTSRTQPGSLTMHGAGSRLVTNQLLARGEVSLTDGAAIEIGKGQLSGLFGAYFEGGVLIDGATLIVDDGFDIGTGRPFGTGLAGSASGVLPKRTRILGGAVVDTEGWLSIFISHDSEIRGAGTIVRQRVQRLREQRPTDPVEIVGHTLILSYHIPPAPAARLDIDDGAMVVGSTMVVGAPVRLANATLLGDEAMIIEPNASLTLRQGAAVASPVLMIGRRNPNPQPWHPPPTATLRGFGAFTGSVSNAGVIDPGEGESIGELTIDGPLRMEPHTLEFPESYHTTESSRLSGSGLLDIDISSPSEHDTLTVTAAATLGGTLRVRMANDYAPAWSDAFVVLQAASINGQFAKLDAPAPPPGLTYELEYTATAASLVVHRRTDLTRDFEVGGEDLGALLTRWGTSDALADLNSDGVVDGADLGILLGDWGLAAQ